MLGLPLFNALFRAGKRAGGGAEGREEGDYAALTRSSSGGAAGGGGGGRGGLGRGSRAVFARISASCKMSSSKILKMVKKWQRFAKPDRSYANLDVHEVPKRPPGDTIELDAHDEAGKPVPEGFVEIYVGREKRRYVINAEYLEREVVKRLIEKSNQKQALGAGEKTDGLSIACEVVLFEHLLWLLKNADEVGTWYDHETDDLADFYAC